MFQVCVRTHFWYLASLTLDVLDQGEMYTERRQDMKKKEDAMSQSASHQVSGHPVSGPGVLPLPRSRHRPEAGIIQGAGIIQESALSKGAGILIQVVRKGVAIVLGGEAGMSPYCYVQVNMLPDEWAHLNIKPASCHYCIKVGVPPSSQLAAKSACHHIPEREGIYHYTCPGRATIR